MLSKHVAAVQKALIYFGICPFSDQPALEHQLRAQRRSLCLLRPGSPRPTPCSPAHPAASETRSKIHPHPAPAPRTSARAPDTSGFACRIRAHRANSPSGAIPPPSRRSLAQFALRRLQRIFVRRIQLARRDLNDHLAQRIAILPLQQHLAVLQQRNDTHRAVVDIIFARGRLPFGRRTVSRRMCSSVPSYFASELSCVSSRCSNCSMLCSSFPEKISCVFQDRPDKLSPERTCAEPGRIHILHHDRKRTLFSKNFGMGTASAAPSVPTGPCRPAAMSAPRFSPERWRLGTSGYPRFLIGNARPSPAAVPSVQPIRTPDGC